jgi:serine/threonine-protein kinase
VLANLLLGYNVFKGRTADESRERIMTMPLPDFSQINPKVDARLNEILHRTLSREVAKRYDTADELLYDLEYYIYHQGYGPTNETLGKFMRELFGQISPAAISEDQGNTALIPKTPAIN